LRTASPN